MSYNYDDQNIFAKILRGEIPNDTVLETEHTLAFRDIAPQKKIHILVIPKGAYVSSEDFTATASDSEIAAFFRLVGEVARMDKVIDGGYRLVSNHGAQANQEVPHFHMHVIGGAPLRGGMPKAIE